jgi:ABC-type transport system involved in Fe-S cluster assembly fused permease/ATPase subunit
LKGGILNKMIRQAKEVNLYNLSLKSLENYMLIFIFLIVTYFFAIRMERTMSVTAFLIMILVYMVITIYNIIWSLKIRKLLNGKTSTLN